MTLYGTSVLVTDKPVRGRLASKDAIPVLSFVPILDGVFDIQPTGSPAAQAAWLRQLAEVASDLALQVEQHAAAFEALARVCGTCSATKDAHPHLGDMSPRYGRCEVTQ